MKVLKLLGFLVLLCIVGILLLGFIKPELNYGHTITADKPLKEAWGVAQDETKLIEWIDGFVSGELIEGEKNKAGAKYKIRVKPSPEEDEFEMTETIVSIREFEHVDLHFETEFGQFDQKMSFIDQDDKTQISTECVVKSDNYFMRTMFAAMELFTGSFQSQEEKNIDQLKKVIEENTTDYYPGEGEGMLD